MHGVISISSNFVFAEVYLKVMILLSYDIHVGMYATEVHSTGKSHVVKDEQLIKL